MGEITYLNKSATKSESLRTTVPYSIVKQFGLTDEDKLDWSLKVEGAELIIQVKPIRTGTILKENRVFSGQHNFLVGSNITNFFAIGDFMKQEDFYAIGYFRKNGDFVIDAKLYSSDGTLIASVKENMVEVKGEALQQLNTVEKDSFHALEVIDIKGNQVLYVELTDKNPTVEIIGRFYDKNNKEIATGTKNDLVVHNGKMVLGASKSGSLGIVMNCSKEECDYLRKFVQDHLPS